MRAANGKIDIVDPFSNVSLDEPSPNKMRDTIITAIEASKRSKVPILFFSNPGYGKTTTVYNYAKHNGYHVEVLCGSQYAQDEILGFQTNEGKESLVIKEPEWYSRIIENKKNNVPSILFLDELSTVCGATQGALLQLCFERRIRGGKSLPDDCLVLAAANYKQNLPGYSEIIAPALNRFCIINLLPENPTDVIMEFTQELSETDSAWPDFSDKEVSQDNQRMVVSEVKQLMNGLFQSYIMGSNKGFLNIRNIEYDGIYDRDDSNPEVLNFISGRTISYLSRMIIALGSMGIRGKDPVYQKIIDGLIGLGTNTWGDTIEEVDARLDKYLRDIHSRAGRILDKLSNIVAPIEKKTSQLGQLQGKSTVSNKITAFIANTDAEKYSTEELVDVTAAIYNKYNLDNFSKVVEDVFKNDDSMLEFRSDMDSIETLISEMEDAQLSIKNIKPYTANFTKIWKVYKFYYDASLVQVK